MECNSFRKIFGMLKSHQCLEKAFRNEAVMCTRLFGVEIYGFKFIRQVLIAVLQGSAQSKWKFWKTNLFQKHLP